MAKGESDIEYCGRVTVLAQFAALPDFLAKLDQHSIRAFGMHKTDELIVGAAFGSFIQ